jgi:hypothetical protein
MDSDTLVGRALSWLSTLLPDPPVGTKPYIDKLCRVRLEWNEERAKPPEQLDTAKVRALYEEMLRLDVNAYEVCV